MKAAVNEDALSFAFRSFGTVLRQNAYWFLGAITLQAIGTYLHVPKLTGYVVTLIVTVPVIVTCCRLMSAEFSPALNRTLGIGLCYAITLAIFEARLPLSFASHRGAAAVVAVIIGDLLAMWIALKIEGASFYYALREYSIAEAFRSSWNYFSGAQWWRWFGISVILLIPTVLVTIPIVPIERANPVVGAILADTFIVILTSLRMSCLGFIVATAER